MSADGVVPVSGTERGHDTRPDDREVEAVGWAMARTESESLAARAKAVIAALDAVRRERDMARLRSLAEGDCLEAARQAIESMRTTGERIPSSGAMALAALTAALDAFRAEVPDVSR